MRQAEKWALKPGAIVSFECDTDRVHVKLASGRTISWPNRGGLTICGEKVITGLQGHATDLLSADGCRIGSMGKDGSQLVVSDYVECSQCHALNRIGAICSCQEKQDETRKTLEGVKKE